ncbi:MAG: DNA cytosine methyltransferase [Negativicutes bacterium]
MNVLSLFSGIGGLDLAAEWAGMHTVAFCEIDDYACKVLEKRWPGVPIYRDVRELTAERLRADGIPQIDLITGGFPCQDISVAGKKAGFVDCDGNTTRSGLWAEYARIIGETKCRWVVAENVRNIFSIPNISNSGGVFGRVLADLEQLGYRAGWCCYGTDDVAGTHQRDRVFIIANSGGVRWRGMEENKQKRFPFLSLEDSYRWASEQNLIPFDFERIYHKPVRGVIRNDNGISEGMDRLRCLGNAVVPQQAYPIFKAIMEAAT